MFIEGIIIVMDLDEFEEYTLVHGYDQYKPNIVTGTLTRLVEELSTKYRGVIIYGHDPARGTEEAVIEIPLMSDGQIRELLNDLERVKQEINKLGARITIVVIRDYVYPRPARNRREAYSGTPGRKRALKLLRKAKRSGGNQIVVEI